MCGIGGILRVHAPGGDIPPPEVAIPEAWLDILDKSIRHRGPDGKGRFRDRVIRSDGSVVDVALVHRRLSIIDHAGGAQPMVSASRRSSGAVNGAATAVNGAATVRERSSFRGLPLPVLFHGAPNDEVAYRSIENTREDLVAVVFNGCIYNHRELRKELQARGHEFITDHSDTEVLIHGWREWGEQLPRHLDGMHALGLWDQRQGSIALMRDRGGEKPLHWFYSGHGGCRAFSSSAGALAHLGDLIDGDGGSDLREDGLCRWLAYGFDTDPPSWQLCGVPPGSTVAPHRWAQGDWQAEEAVALPTRQQDEPAMSLDRVDGMLCGAVTSRLESDVELGCFLSGGVDSSLVAEYARRSVPGLQTFTVRMPDGRYDESEYATEVARQLQTNHTTLECECRPAEDLIALISQIGLPFGDSSLLPTYWVSRAARQHVKVVLSGDGGDELFCGYERYRGAELLWRHRRLLGMIPPVGVFESHPRSSMSRAARLARAARGDGYLDLMRIFDRAHLEALSPRVAGRAGTLESASVPDAPRWDFEHYLPEDLMRKTDSASMCVALEVRAPFLARELVTACLAEPLTSLMPRGERKGLLRAVARRYLPPEIVNRPKMGFAIPIGEWFRSDYGGMRQLLMDHLNSAEPWGPPRLRIELNMKLVRRLINEHMNERRDHSQRLYMLLVLSIWAKWLGGLK